MLSWCFQHRGELLRRTLRALIRVKDIWHAIPSQRLLQGLNAKMCLHRMGQAPGQDFPTLLIHDRHQREEPALDRNSGDVGAPHLLRSCDRQIPQQIRINPMLRVRLTRTRFLIHRVQAQQCHQPAYPVPPHVMPLSS